MDHLSLSKKKSKGGSVTYAWGGAGHEDQTPQIRGTFVAQRASSVDQGANTVRLNGATD